jgi:hypothetical protein
MMYRIFIPVIGIILSVTNPVGEWIVEPRSKTEVFQRFSLLVFVNLVHMVILAVLITRNI